MTPEEYARYLADAEQSPMIDVRDIGGASALVLEGYDVDRRSFTVEIVAGEFEVTVDGTVVARGERLPASVMYPNKRAYVETTDLRFARAMRAADHELTFIRRYGPASDRNDRRAATYAAS